MFQSISYKLIPHENYTPAHYTFDLTDSDFLALAVPGPTYLHVIIREYSKRNLNVAANIVRYIMWYQKRSSYFHSIADCLDAAMAYNPDLISPQLKLDLQKYLVLI